MGKDTLGAQIFCSIMWKLLYARNQIIFNQANPFPPEIANAARDFVVDFNEAVPKKTKSRKHGAQQEPSSNFLCSCDFC